MHLLLLLRKYLYHEIPEHFVWNSQQRKWTIRKKTSKPVLSRMYNVDPRAGELFFLRVLLLHKCGCTSFEDIRTVI